MGIEHVEELTKLSTVNVQSWLDSKPMYNGSAVDLRLGEQIKLVTGDGRQGYLPDAPYDAIHVGAAAPSIPQPVSAPPGDRFLPLFKFIGFNLFDRTW